ncbi:MAG TPA: class E sortase [Rubrobacteraceae bacterium]|nr:class E sortase [Rubrobacteraceae bacterium]
MFLGLVVLTLLAMIFLGPDGTLELESGVVERVEDPTVAGPPEIVSEKEEEEAAPPPEDPTLFLTVPRLGLFSHTVRNDESESALDLGAIKLPYTGFPWERGANTYIACHRLGWPGNESFNQCLNLPSIRQGDEVFLTDTTGRVYQYRVSEIVVISPYDVWIADPLSGRDVVSLQTCVEGPNDFATLGPNWTARYVVRADKVA